MAKIFSILYLVASSIYLSSLALPQTPIHFVLKVLPILVLLAASTRAPKPLEKTLLVMAVLFSGFGDVLLAFSWFVYGLGAFLIAQVFYACVFLRHFDSIKTRWPLSVALLAYAVAMVITLEPHLGEMQVPVFAYLVVIMFMGFAAIQSSYPTRWLVLGALCFIASDSLIALNRFVQPLPFSDYLVMSTYYAAQYMIVAGCLRRTR